MEPLSTSVILASIVGYLAKSLNEDKSIKTFFSDFSEATVKWIGILFDSKNVNLGNISAEGEVHIGDKK